MKLTYIYTGRKNSDRQKLTALAASLFGAGKLAEDIECILRERSLPKRLDLRIFEDLSERNSPCERGTRNSKDFDSCLICWN